jgi:hypothetical protein
MLIGLIFPAFSGDIGLAFEDARFHADFLGGFAPFYVRAGMDYSGLEFIEGQKTNLILIGGGAIVHSSIWRDLNGLPLEPDGVVNNTDEFDDSNAYSRWQGDFSIKLNQGIMQEPGRDKAFLALYGKYGFHWTDPHENWKEGSVDSVFLDGSSIAYPDNAGTISNVIQIGAELDRLDKGDIYSGFNVNTSLIWGPSWLFNTAVGNTDFYNLNLTAKYFYPLLDLKRQDGDLTLIGIYLADRVQIDYLSGEAIPQFYQESPALGSKMRGFEGMSMGTEFTIVNNFDVRFYGIEFLDNINPIFTVFFDMGYHGGNYYNTSTPGDAFVASTGVNFQLNVVDFAQVGYMLAFPVYGENLQELAMQGGIEFQYKF